MASPDGKWATLRHWLGIELSPVSHAERIVSGVGGCLGILVVLLVSGNFGFGVQMMLIASMGATAVLIYGVPHGALAQPWPVIGGNVLSACIGVACYRWISEPIVAATVAVGLAITAMHYLRCLHPPGGATALIAVIGGPEIHEIGFLYALCPVGLGVVLMVLLAIAFNALFPWRRYPVAWAQRSQRSAPPLALQHEDFAAALRQIDSFIDVDEDDLQHIFALAEQHAHERRALHRKSLLRRI